MVDMIPTIRIEASESIRYPKIRKSMPKVSCEYETRLNLETMSLPSSIKSVIDATVSASPNRASSEWKPRRFRFLVANPSGPINAYQFSLVKTIDYIRDLDDTFVVGTDDDSLSTIFFQLG